MSMRRAALAHGLLPDDVLHAIMARLPWAVQARCRCVCRRWNHTLLHNMRRPFPIVQVGACDYADWMLLDPLSLHCRVLPARCSDKYWAINLRPLAASTASEDVIFVDYVKSRPHLSWLDLDTMQWKLIPWPQHDAGPFYLNFGMAILDGFVYIAGGGHGIASNSAQRLRLRDNLASQVWECLPDMYERRNFSKVLVFGGCVCVLGGITHDGKCINSGEMWDPNRREWIFVPELWPCNVFGKLSFYPKAVVVRGRLYAISRRTDDIVYYEPSRKLWNTLCSLSLLDPQLTSISCQLLAVGIELWVAVHPGNNRRANVFRTTVMPATSAPEVSLRWKTLPLIVDKKLSCTETFKFTNVVVRS